MKKTILAALIAMASIGAHAQAASDATQGSPASPVTYKTSFDCKKASSYSEHTICEDADLAARDSAYWGAFQSARKASADKKAFHDHAVAAFKERQKCDDTACIVSWFDDNEKYIRSLTEAQGVAIDDAASQKRGILTATAKQMDSEWQIYAPARRECETLHVFMMHAGGNPAGIDTPEQFAAYYGHGATVKYGHGGDAAEIDGGDVKFMLAHGTDACNEMAKAIRSDGY